MSDEAAQQPPDAGDGEQLTPTTSGDSVEKIRADMEAVSAGAGRRGIEKILMAAIGGIPWVGGYLSALGALAAEHRGVAINHLQREWLEEHQRRLNDLEETLARISERLSGFAEVVEQRVASDNFLGLVTRAFGTWDRADTEDKRRIVANLITNAAATEVTSDDLLRMFIDWIDRYHEAHFAVIREIYRSPGITRWQIWQRIHGGRHREDSSEADLFKLLVRDLSTGGIIRQERAVTGAGEFVRNRPGKRKGQRPAHTMASAFDDGKEYVLTSLGQEFVHYALTDTVRQIGGEE